MAKEEKNDAKSAVEEFKEQYKEKSKAYKSPIDVERVFHLISSIRQLADSPAYAAISASFSRELSGIALKQADQNEKDQEEYTKGLNEAEAKDAKKLADQRKKEAEEAAKSPPIHSQPRDTYSGVNR